MNENEPMFLCLAMKIDWTLNVVIVETELTRYEQIANFAETRPKKKNLKII